MSKKLFFGVLVAVVLYACNAGQNQEPGITGNISGAQNETVYLEKYINNRPQAVDSAVIDESGAFFIPMKNDMVLDYYSLRLGNNKSLVLITDSSESVVIEAEADQIDTPQHIEGSENTEILNNFQKEMKEYAEKADSLQKAFQDPNASAERKAQIRSRFTEVISEKNDFARNFIDKNLPKPAVLAGLSQLDMATDMEYYEKVQKVLKDDFDHSFYYQSVNTQIASYKKQEKLKASGQVKRQEKNSKYSEGMMAPNIEMEDPDGKTRSLKDLRGKVVLVDFWAAWCGPCRRENPNLVKTYHKYKDDGFDIFSVSFDKTKKRWVQAIEKDNLTWENHVSDLKGWQNAAGQEYGISSIPHTILLDKEGKIIATKLRGAALDNKLKKVFGH